MGKRGSFTDFFKSKHLQDETKGRPIVEAWKNLDERMDPFERLKELRELVLQEKVSPQTYDALYRLATERATGKETWNHRNARKGLKSSQMLGRHRVFDTAIVEGSVEYREANRSNTGGTWKRSYMLVMPTRIEVYVSRSEAKQRRHPRMKIHLSEKFYVADSKLTSNEHIFVVSDFRSRFYFAAVDAESRELWDAYDFKSRS